MCVGDVGGPVKRAPERPLKTGLEKGWILCRGEETVNGLYTVE